MEQGSVGNECLAGCYQTNRGVHHCKADEARSRQLMQVDKKQIETIS
jgi:hypothetical protein